jgi:hypothetical protein
MMVIAVATRGTKRRVIAGMSGAQAAAADLLRARASEVEQPDVDEALIAAASAMFTAFETFYKSRRMYQDGHPALDRFFTQLEAKVRASLGSLGELDVAVTALGLEHAGCAVYTAAQPEHNMWFPLYRDGIRELTFCDGIDRDQISRLCGAIVRLASIKPGAEDDDGEDDAVTMLWDLALEDVSYIAIDSYADDNAVDANARARIERIREIVTVSMMKELVVPAGAGGHDIERARRLKSVAITKADLTVLQGQNLAAIDELPASVREANGDLYALDAPERGALARGLGDESGLDEKLLDAIINALLADGGEEHGGPLCARVEQAFTAIVVGGGFERAVRLRRQVMAAARAMTEIPLWSKLDDAMAGSAALGAICDAVATRDDNLLPDVIALVEVMPPVAARGLVPGLAKVEQRRRRRWVCDLIAPWGPPVVDAAVAALSDSSEELALDLLYLLKCVGSSAAGTALERATRHPAASIRANGLRMLAEMSPGSVGSRVRAALSDPDPNVRAVALELAIAHRPDGCEQWIKHAIAGEAMSALDLGEKKRLFIAYATIGGERVAPELLARLEQRNLLARSGVDEERSAAATALGQIGYEAARGPLEKLAHGKLVRAMVRDACTEALAALDRPRVEPVVAPAPVAVSAPIMPAVPEPLIDAAPDAPPAPAVSFRPTSKLPKPTPPEPAPAQPPALAVGTSTLPRTPSPAPAAPSHAVGTAPLPKTTPPGKPTPGAPAPRETRPDPRSASGRRPMDDGVVVVRPRPGAPKGPKRGA